MISVQMASPEVPMGRKAENSRPEMKRTAGVNKSLSSRHASYRHRNSTMEGKLSQHSRASSYTSEGADSLSRKTENEMPAQNDPKQVTVGTEKQDENSKEEDNKSRWMRFGLIFACCVCCTSQWCNADWCDRKKKECFSCACCEAVWQCLVCVVEGCACCEKDDCKCESSNCDCKYECLCLCCFSNCDSCDCNGCDCDCNGCDCDCNGCDCLCDCC